jgi:hypothetical protein
MMLLTTFVANIKQLCFKRAVAQTQNIKLKDVLKRKALFGNQTVVLTLAALRAGLIHAFKNFFDPFFVIGNSMTTPQTPN